MNKLYLILIIVSIVGAAYTQHKLEASAYHDAHCWFAGKEISCEDYAQSNYTNYKNFYAWYG